MLSVLVLVGAAALGICLLSLEIHLLQRLDK